MPTLQDELRSRWSPKWNGRSDLSAVQTMFENALSWIDAPKAKGAELTRSGTLSEKGVKMTLRAHFAPTVRQELRRYTADVAAEAEAIKASRASLTRPTFDKADLIGELQRQEARTWLRSMEPMQRLITLLGDKDGNLIEAAFAAPAYLSGLDKLTDVQRGQIEETFVQARFAPQIAAIEEREEANALARVAVRAAVMELRDAAGLEPLQFDTWFETGLEPATEAA